MSENVYDANITIQYIVIMESDNVSCLVLVINNNLGVFQDLHIKWRHKILLATAHNIINFTS